MTINFTDRFSSLQIHKFNEFWVGVINTNKSQNIFQLSFLEWIKPHFV